MFYVFYFLFVFYLDNKIWLENGNWVTVFFTFLGGMEIYVTYITEIY